LIKYQTDRLAWADREFKIDIFKAIFAYRGITEFWKNYNVFDLCKIKADNATGLIQFGGGMFGGIHILPNEPVANPAKFELINPQSADIKILYPVKLPKAKGWVKQAENDGYLQRDDAPKDLEALVPLDLLHPQYLELFEQCSAASITVGGECFGFLGPHETEVFHDEAIGDYVPIVDLRDMGGLVSFVRDGKPVVGWMGGGGSEIDWSEPDLQKAIVRLWHEMME